MPVLTWCWATSLPRHSTHGHHAAVPLCVLVLDARLLLEAQVGEGFARAIAEWLLALWCVDGMDAHLHLFIGVRLAAAGCEGVRAYSLLPMTAGLCTHSAMCCLAEREWWVGSF